MTRAPREPHEIHCKHCLKRRDLGYMLTDEAWAAFGYQYDELACYPCVEKVSGRPLAFEHLRPVPANLHLVLLRFPERRYEYVDAVGEWLTGAPLAPISVDTATAER